MCSSDLYHFIQSRIEQAGCRTRRDSTRFVDTLITASPDFFKKKSPKEIQDFFQRAADFLIGRVGKENIVSAVVHMDEKTPHLHLVFVPLTEDNYGCGKTTAKRLRSLGITTIGALAKADRQMLLSNFKSQGDYLWESCLLYTSPPGVIMVCAKRVLHYVRVSSFTLHQL